MSTYFLSLIKEQLEFDELQGLESWGLDWLESAVMGFDEILITISKLSVNKEAEVLFEEGRTTAVSSLPIPALAWLAFARSRPRRSHTAVELQPRLLEKDMQRD